MHQSGMGDGDTMVSTEREWVADSDYSDRWDKGYGGTINWG